MKNPLASFINPDEVINIPASEVLAKVVEVAPLPVLELNLEPEPEESRHDEWHVTVEGISPALWHHLCTGILGIKPLLIELSDRRLQLMCEASFDPRDIILSAVKDLAFGDDLTQFRIVRVKHEVSALIEGEVAVYWEAHFKFNGPWRPDRKGVSRDIFRAHEERWYITHRQETSFDASIGVETMKLLAKHSTFAEYEYEACILDTNPALDLGWL